MSKKPKEDEAKTEKVNIVFTKYEKKYYFAKILKTKVQYCETEIKKGKGVMIIGSQYKFNGGEAKDCNTLVELPSKFFDKFKNNTMSLDIEARAELGTYIFNYAK